eukprot:m.90551 g.90551  ORF g.90551 m.90551 type:complete len:300 (-) comp13271_c0_seq7:1260-2159(-)
MEQNKESSEVGPQDTSETKQNANGNEQTQPLKHEGRKRKLFELLGSPEEVDLEATSLNQLKKLVKEKEWQVRAGERRIKRREERKELRLKNKAAKEQGLPLVQKRPRNRPKAVKTKQRVAIDLDYENYQTPDDSKKLMNQVIRCYSENRKLEKGLDYYLTSLTGRCREKFVQQNGSQWDLEHHEKSYLEVFNKEELVYLSSESENVLLELDDSKVYVIGGLVDHNKHKGLSHSLALKHGISHARLPIDEFVKMEGRKVLTVNHVFEIMLHYLNTNNWKTSFFNVLPQRKQVSEAKDQGE